MSALRCCYRGGRDKKEERERIRRIAKVIDFRNNIGIVSGLTGYQLEKHEAECNKRRIAIEKKEHKIQQEKERKKQRKKNNEKFIKDSLWEFEQLNKNLPELTGYRKQEAAKIKNVKKDHEKNSLCLSCDLYDIKRKFCSVTRKQEFLRHCLFYKLKT